MALLTTSASPMFKKNESRFEREQRIKIGSISGYDPRKEAHTARYLLRDNAYLDRLAMEDEIDRRYRGAGSPNKAALLEANDHTYLEKNRSQVGCNITRYSGNQHRYSPLSSSLSELNLAQCKTPTPPSLRHMEDHHYDLSRSAPYESSFDKGMAKSRVKHDIYSRNLQNDDVIDESRSKRIADFQQSDTERELQIIRDAESRKHSYTQLPNKKSPIELERYEDFPVEDIKLSIEGISFFEKFLTTALFDFKAENKRELDMRKGDVIKVLRKVDSNWYEGELHGEIGIFPISYVAAPHKGSNSSTLNKRSKSTPTIATGRAKFSYQAQTPIEMSLKKGDVVSIKRHIDKNWIEGQIGSRIGIFPSSYIDQQTTTTKPITMTHSLPRMTTSSLSSNIESKIQQMPEPKLPKPYERDNPFIQKQSDISIYRALFDYKPQNEDEVELLEGDMICVVEKCDDGWYVGTSQRTGSFGTFPGNYVILV